MRKISLTLLLLGFVTGTFAQDFSDFILQDNSSDTIFCFITELNRSVTSGQTTSLTYIDKKRVEHKLKKDDLNKIACIRIGDILLYRVPTNPSKSNSAEAHYEKFVDGEIKVFYYISLFATTNRKGERSIYKSVASRPIMQLGKDKYVKETPLGWPIKNEIYPYMAKCTAFKKMYPNVSENTLFEAIGYYNQHCEKEKEQ